MEYLHQFNTGFWNNFPMIAMIVWCMLAVVFVGLILRVIVFHNIDYINYLVGVFAGVPIKTKVQGVNFLTSPPELGSWMKEPLAENLALAPITCSCSECLKVRKYIGKCKRCGQVERLYAELCAACYCLPSTRNLH